MLFVSKGFRSRLGRALLGSFRGGIDRRGSVDHWLSLVDRVGDGVGLTLRLVFRLFAFRARVREIEPPPIMCQPEKKMYTYLGVQ